MSKATIGVLSPRLALLTVLAATVAVPGAAAGPVPRLTSARLELMPRVPFEPGVTGARLTARAVRALGDRAGARGVVGLRVTPRGGGLVVVVPRATTVAPADRLVGSAVFAAWLPGQVVATSADPGPLVRAATARRRPGAGAGSWYVLATATSRSHPRLTGPYFTRSEARALARDTGLGSPGRVVAFPAGLTVVSQHGIDSRGHRTGRETYRLVRGAPVLSAAAVSEASGTKLALTVGLTPAGVARLAASPSGAGALVTVNGEMLGTAGTGSAAVPSLRLGTVGRLTGDPRIVAPLIEDGMVFDVLDARVTGSAPARGGAAIRPVPRSMRAALANEASPGGIDEASPRRMTVARLGDTRLEQWTALGRDGQEVAAIGDPNNGAGPVDPLPNRGQSGCTFAVGSPPGCFVTNVKWPYAVLPPSSPGVSLFPWASTELDNAQAIYQATYWGRTSPDVTRVRLADERGVTLASVPARNGWFLAIVRRRFLPQTVTARAVAPGGRVVGTATLAYPWDSL